VRKVEPTDVVIVEGILVLQDPELREQLNMKVRGALCGALSCNG